jgi:hypothetical protein
MVMRSLGAGLCSARAVSSSAALLLSLIHCSAMPRDCRTSRVISDIQIDDQHRMIGISEFADGMVELSMGEDGNEGRG